MNIYTDVSGTTVDFAIHTDTSRVTADGQPDPDYLVFYSFPAPDMTQKPQGVTNNQYKAAYVNQCKAEARLLAVEARKAQRKTARKLSDYGAPEAAADS